VHFDRTYPHLKRTVPGGAGEALLPASPSMASSYTNGLAAGVGSLNRWVVSLLSQITDPLRTPSEQISSISFARLLAHLLVVR
jgi:hypothetical protein